MEAAELCEFLFDRIDGLVNKRGEAHIETSIHYCLLRNELDRIPNCVFIGGKESHPQNALYQQGEIFIRLREQGKDKTDIAFLKNI